MCKIHGLVVCFVEFMALCTEVRGLVPEPGLSGV